MLFRLAFALVSITLLVGPIDAASQDMLSGVDLNSVEMSTPEMTRAEVDALLKAAQRGPADQRSANLQGKRLSQLDLSGLDFSGSNLRLAKLNRTRSERRALRSGHPEPGVANRCGFDRGLPHKDIAARHADATCQAWRRRFERRAHNRGSFRRQPDPRQACGRRFERGYAQPIDGPDAWRAQIRRSQECGSERRQSLARQSQIREAAERQSGELRPQARRPCWSRSVQREPCRRRFHRG